MKDLSSKSIIPADQLSEWRSWAPGELEKEALFEGLSPEQVRALSAAFGGDAPSRAPVEPLPEPDLIDEAPPQQLGYPTAAELETIHQEAWQGGHDAGFAAGLEEGRAQGLAEGRAGGLDETRQRFADAWQPLEMLAGNFSRSLSALEDELAPALLDLAVRLAERLVAAHLAADPAAIEPLLRESLGALPATIAQGRLRVNPQDLDVARSFLGQERPETAWQWIEDPAVARGGCLLETPSLTQDLTLPSRMRALSRALGLEPVDPAEEGDDESA
jgi:flagellar assembly protein FliH